MAARYMNSLIEYLRKVKNIDLFQNTQLIDIKNTSKGVTLKVKSNKEEKIIVSKKVALTCGRWIGQIVPEVKDILKSVRQTVSFLKMKNPQKYKLGVYPTWYHLLNGTPVYCLPDV